MLLFAAILTALVALTLSDMGMSGRSAIIATVCLLLWLTQWVPVWLPTLVLWVATPVLLWHMDARYAPLEVLRWSVDPVIALFLGGFALAAAARFHGIDTSIANAALKWTGHSSTRLLISAAFATAFLSMWMSNVAAAALMLNAFRPIWEREPAGSSLRRALLLVIALAADVGGIATPIGTGANGIALASVAHVRQITFLHWMTFGVPLAAGLVVAAVALVVIRLRPPAPQPQATPQPSFARSFAIDNSPQAEKDRAPSTKKGGQLDRIQPHHRVGVVFIITVLLWLSEPLHGLPAWMVAIGTVVALLVFRVLPWRQLALLDWGTLMLVAGGIGMGALLDRSGIVASLSERLATNNLPELVQIFALCVVSATLSALMSNTGTAALLIPLAASINPSPSIAILVAVAASLGVPFVISTPPNAMAVSGGLKSMDLLVPGLILMLGGCLLITLTGQAVLHAVGVP
jgi:solute carrier family 13 (sodium-dependent dicarboxylate transporter), member 2/3/5